MNESMKAPALLRAAARLVQRAREQMNDTAHKCTCCGTERFENLAEARGRQRLGRALNTLEEVAAQLEGAPVPVEVDHE
jgi:hypothetical protein